MELIRINDKDYIQAKDLYIELGIKRQYSQWIRESTDRADLEQDKDFIKQTLASTGGRPGIEYMLTLQSAMLVVMISQKTQKAVKIYKELSEIMGTNVIQIQRTRKELLFEINLNEILKGITKIIPQYSVLEYRIDFYLPDLNIAIEYDESTHKNYKNDNKRQTDIENYLQCDFIRIKEGFELIGLNQIYKVVMYNILIDLWQKDKLNEDQTGILERIGMEMPKIINRKSMASKMKLGNIIWDDTKENPLKINQSEISERQNNYYNIKSLLA